MRNTRVTAVVMLSAVLLAVLSGCALLGSSGSSCDNEPDPPESVTAPVAAIARSVEALDGVNSVKPVFSQQSPGPCSSERAYADGSWQSSLTVDMIGTASPAQIETVIQLVAGRLPTSVLVPAGESRAKLILALPGGVANALPIAEAQAIAKTPGMTAIRLEQKVGPNGPLVNVDSSVDRLSAVPRVVSVIEQEPWLNGELAVEDDPRFTASIRNREPSTELITAIVSLVEVHSHARVTSFDLDEIHIDTDDDHDVSGIAAALARIPLSDSSPATPVTFAVSGGTLDSTKTGVVAVG